MMHLIHINRHKIVKNRKHGTKEAPIAVRRGRSGSAQYGSEANVVDEKGNVIVSFKYTPEKPLSCGAVVYAEVSPHYRVAVQA